MPAHSSNFIRALVDDASTQPFFSSLLALKRQRESSALASPRVQASREPECVPPTSQVERIRDRAA